MKNGAFSLIRRYGATFLSTVAVSSAAHSQCYQSSIMSPTPFMGNHGEIFKLLDGSLWRVAYAYEYLYEYYPNVIICPDKNSLIVDNKRLHIEKLSSSGGATVKRDSSIQSRIDGDFSGWEGESIYRLQNGQIWQQAEYKYRYTYRYAPGVIIIQHGGSFFMQVDGDSEAVRVRKIN